MTRPSLLEVQSELRIVKRVSWILSIGLTLFLIILWPVIMTVAGDYSLPVFKFWIIIGHIFVYISFIYCLIGPIVETYYKDVWNWLKSKRIHRTHLTSRTAINPSISKIRYSYNYED